MAPTLQALLLTYKDQPQDSQKAILEELREIHRGWFRSMDSAETEDDVNTLKILCQILEALHEPT